MVNLITKTTNLPRRLPAGKAGQAGLPDYVIPVRTGTGGQAGLPDFVIQAGKQQTTPDSYRYNKQQTLTSMAEINPNIEESWKKILYTEFQSPYFMQLKLFLAEEKKKYIIYPQGAKIFSAFDHTPFGEVKVVIIGQDPYHGKGQANGLCFSVSDGITKPPSLVNIFKEINSDIGVKIPVSGNLEKWAKQGIMLLNATLTVRENQAGSHQKKGWEMFTDAVIRTLSEKREGLIFILWGAFAQAKEKLIDINKHHVLKAAHPSPFSAYNGFFGCKHFSKTNELLKKMGKEEINWDIN